VEAREGASEAHFLLRGEQAREVSRTVTAKGRVKRELAWERYEFAADQVVVAVGGVEAAALVPGCTWKPMRPLLVPVRTEVDAISGLDGLRVAVDLRIPERSFSEHGEVLFRTYGLSGIVVLNASRYARPGDLLELDFAPDWSLDELRTSLACRLDRSSWHAAERPSFAQVLQGFLPAKLTAAILKQAGLDPSHPATADGLASFGASCKSFPLQVRGLAVEQACQVH
jgi:predicted flavoprotein YhiN